MYPLSVRFNSVYKPITERLMGTLMFFRFGLPKKLNGDHRPGVHIKWILEARTGVQIGLHLGAQMDPIQGPKIGPFWVPQNHASLNATDQVGTSARKRSMSNLMDALMGLQAHPPRDIVTRSDMKVTLRSLSQRGILNPWSWKSDMIT